MVDESRDGQGAGDRNKDFEFGHPRACLTTMQQARLTIMRGYIIDHAGAIHGDDDYVYPTPSGVLVPWINDYWKEDPNA